MQMKFRLPGYLHKRIEETSKRNGWSASEEIRRRLEISFTEEVQSGDQETFRLIQAIKSLAHNVEQAFGSWHENRFAFDVFRAAVFAILDLHRPIGERVRPADNEIADMYLGEGGAAGDRRQHACRRKPVTAAGMTFPIQRARQERR